MKKDILPRQLPPEHTGLNSATPGPWAFVDGEIVGGPDGAAHIALMPDATDFPCADEDDEQRYEAELRANALLVAAAPDLYEALKKLANEAAGFLALSDVERHGMTNSRILRDRIEIARDVIRKAEGK